MHCRFVSDVKIDDASIHVVIQINGSEPGVCKITWKLFKTLPAWAPSALKKPGLEVGPG